VHDVGSTFLGAGSEGCRRIGAEQTAEHSWCLTCIVGFASAGSWIGAYLSMTLLRGPPRIDSATDLDVGLVDRCFAGDLKS
jgi:hypothetical protein